MMKDEMGDRMKDLEHRTRYMLPRRCYTLIRIDGKAFHSYTRGMERPFDQGLREDMQETTRLLCEGIAGCRLGYTQSDEISLVLTDFDKVNSEAWFDGNLQKVTSVSASMATAYFNMLRAKRAADKRGPAMFDSRVWATADPWEVYNTFWWRQKDATRNAVQMVARALAPHKECTNKNFSQLNELIFQKGQNFNDYPTDCRRGAFIVKGDAGWVVDKESPILSQDRQYLFSRLPLIPRPGEGATED